MQNPLAEVFGYPTSDFSREAARLRRNKLCPFNNRVPSCTKDKAKDPLGVCSIFSNSKPVTTCPIRFRERWIIVEDAASFFFNRKYHWTSITEVNLTGRNGKSAGNIDMVLVAYDEHGRVVDFGSLEIQAVYISGNVRRPFEYYLKNTRQRKGFDWTGKPNYPKPDFLSSSRKRLIPQVLYKGGILRAWRKKQAVAMQKAFFDTLPDVPKVKCSQADLAWLLYDLKFDKKTRTYRLAKKEVVYTKFEPALDRIITPKPGPVKDFIEVLQQKLDEKLEGNPPDVPTLTDVILT